MLLKVDFQKAYDSLEWGFMDLMLKTWGFTDDFRKLVMSYVTIVHYNLLINRSISGNFKPTYGIRRGDPLSPFLFILYMQLFSRMVANEKG